MGGYFKGKVTFEYVSESPLKNLPIDLIAAECAEGGAVGQTINIEEQEIDRTEADALALAFGSDEDFFGPEEEEC